MLVGKDMVMEMAVYQLAKNDKGQYLCPKCQGNLRFVDGTAVQIVDGRADMSAILPKYECHHCGIYFQELLGSGFFDEHDLPQQPKTKVLNVRRTGDLEPMILKKDVNNQCVCPRCGELMDFVEGQPVHIVDGKPDMENVKDHFRCPHCDSVYRRIATTDYFQWSEK